MRVLVLDDSEIRQKAFRKALIGTINTHVFSYAQCILAFETQLEPFDVVFLDHDLSDAAAAGKPGQFEKTGTHVAEYIVALPASKRPKKVILHTLNPVGRDRMLSILRNAGISTVIQPFSAPSETK